MVHRATGYLMLLCLVSAACLCLGPLAQLVGRRHTRTGYVSRSWAQRYHSRWLREEHAGDGGEDAADRRMT